MEILYTLISLLFAMIVISLWLLVCELTVQGKEESQIEQTANEPNMKGE
jgi:competence protein ComGC